MKASGIYSLPEFFSSLRLLVTSSQFSFATKAHNRKSRPKRSRLPTGFANNSCATVSVGSTQHSHAINAPLLKTRLAGRSKSMSFRSDSGLSDCQADTHLHPDSSSAPRSVAQVLPVCEVHENVHDQTKDLLWRRF